MVAPIDPGRLRKIHFLCQDGVQSNDSRLPICYLLSAICYSARLSRAGWMSYDQVSWNDPIQLLRLMTFPWPTLWPGLLSALTCSAMVLPESQIFPDLLSVSTSCSRKPGCLLLW